MQMMVPMTLTPCFEGAGAVRQQAREEIGLLRGVVEDGVPLML